MVRIALEQSFAHAPTVFGSAADAANQALANWQNRHRADANEIVRKSVALADENVATAFEFAEKLIHTKHPIQVVQLQQQYLVRQMQTLPSQTQELSRVGLELLVRSASRFPFFRRKIKADHPTW
jgi:hypothetical protein